MDGCIRRHRQSGRLNLVSLIMLAGLALAVYGAIKLVPIYIEKSRISRLVKQAANQWVNVTPNLEQVKKDLQQNLETSQVESISANDVSFARISNDEVEAWVEYQVVITHPVERIEPTTLNFRIDHVARRTMSY